MHIAPKVRRYVEEKDVIRLSIRLIWVLLPMAKTNLSSKKEIRLKVRASLNFQVGIA